MRLKSHQRKAIDAALSQFKKRGGDQRGILHMACASGKTLVGQRVHEELGSQVTLLMVPTLNLIRQSLDDYLTHRKQDFEFLCVCSDVSVVEGFAEEASALELEVTTDVDVVRRFVTAKNTIPKIIFCTYQSSPVLQKLCAQGDTVFDLIICDEAHRTAAGGRHGSGHFKTVLDQKRIRGRNRLFMTATPRCFSSRVKTAAEAAGFEVSSMDDPTLYGPTLFRFSFGEAIKARILSDYRIVMMGVTKNEISKAIQNREFVNHGGEVVDAETVAKHIAVAKAIHRFGLKKLLVFHSRIDDANRFSGDEGEPYSFQHTLQAANLLSNRKVWLGVVSSRTRTARRLQCLKTFESNDELSLLSNAKCLTEGVNVPALNGIVLMHPKYSIVDITQTVGRVIRLDPKWVPKSKADRPPPGYIIIPLVLSSDDPDEVIDNSAFETVGAVLRELRSHDDVLADVIDQFRGSLGDRPPVFAHDTVFAKLEIIDLPENLDTESVRRAIVSRVVELSHDSWMAHRNAVKAFQEKEGLLRLPKDPYKGLDLRTWAERQRSAHRRGRLSPSKVELLESLPQWRWDPKEAVWQAHLDELRKRKGVMAGAPKFLVKWASRCRVDYRKGTLSPARIQEMGTLPNWKWETDLQGNRGVRKVSNRPTLTQLKRDIRKFGYRGTGDQYGVSDNAIRKWLRDYNVTVEERRALTRQGVGTRELRRDKEDRSAKNKTAQS